MDAGDLEWGPLIQKQRFLFEVWEEVRRPERRQLDAYAEPRFPYPAPSRRQLVQLRDRHP